MILYKILFNKYKILHYKLIFKINKVKFNKIINNLIKIKFHNKFSIIKIIKQMFYLLVKFLISYKIKKFKVKIK